MIDGSIYSGLKKGFKKKKRNERKEIKLKKKGVRLVKKRKRNREKKKKGWSKKKKYVKKTLSRGASTPVGSRLTVKMPKKIKSLKGQNLKRT